MAFNQYYIISTPNIIIISKELNTPHYILTHFVCWFLPSERPGVFVQSHKLNCKPRGAKGLEDIADRQAQGWWRMESFTAL